MRPLSSHLPRNLNVKTSVEWLGRPSINEIHLSERMTQDETLTEESYTSFNTYDINYSPTKRGAYLINIKLYGEDVSGSPLYVRVAETNASSLSIARKRGKTHHTSRPSTAMSITRPMTSPLRPSRASSHSQTRNPRKSKDF